MSDPKLPTVSVIVPARNEERCIAACLESVAAQDYPKERVEIWVADGRSDDRTREIVARLAERDPRIRLVDNPGRIVPTGMNAAIVRSQGELIVRVDAHTTIPPDYLAQVVASFARSRADCVGGRMEARGEGYWGTVIAHVTSHPFGVGGARFHYSRREGPADTVYLGAYRRETLMRIGLYDERFVRNQDDELNYRLRKMGGTVWFSPAIRAFYVNRATLGQLFRQYEQYGFWKVRLYRKHPRMFRARHAIPALFVGAWACGIFLALAGAVRGEAVAVGLPALHLSAGLMAALLSRWRLRIALGAPLGFLVLHVAYGLGTWRGLADAFFTARRFATAGPARR